MLRFLGAFLTVVCLPISTSIADQDSIGPNGIRSSSLNLTGAGIAIGQVETGRPGVPGIIDDPRTHVAVMPTAVFRQDGLAHPDDTILPHGLQVASVMISKDTGNLAGVAKDAQLYASAFGAVAVPPEDIMKTIQRVASSNGGDIRAINHSYGILPPDFVTADGNSYLTLGLDWSAAAHNVLHVVAGENFDGNPLPGDNYNGMTIAMSRRDDGGVFREVDPDTNFYGDAVDAGRVWVDLIAPGRDIDVAGFNSSTTMDAFGTSLAAPHVTGTVALLQQFADAQITAGEIGWSGSPGTANANRHEVMKAVLLNSADKLAGVHGSTRTIESRNISGSYTWPDSPAATSAQIPLDLEFGAGHLNAQRAVQQFQNGEWDPGSPVARIGWDFGETGGPGTIIRYPFAAFLGGGYIAITLAWDRFVDKTGSTTSYSTSDLFFGAGLNDLDLYLMPSGWVDFNEAITGLYSVSADSNVEHIFAEVPPGNYEIVVNHFPGGLETDQEFALAWWYGDPPPVTLAGDFNGDTRVNGLDFLAWQRGESPRGPLDAQDLADWQANYGFGTLAGVEDDPAHSFAVPEPSSMLLTVFAAMAMAARLPHNPLRVADQRCASVPGHVAANRS